LKSILRRPLPATNQKVAKLLQCGIAINPRGNIRTLAAVLRIALAGKYTCDADEEKRCQRKKSFVQLGPIF
jgi:hypothetical protein